MSTSTTTTTTTTSTTTTEISSNSNSSCRLLVCLNSLPFHDQRVFRSLLGHIELVRLSACCRSLRNSIRNDKALWQQLYHRDFLSGAYYAKEMDFVLWCIRTDVNNPCTSDKRADLLENVDWYNTYRRRVSTENNWRYGRRNTTHIDMKSDKDEVHYSSDFDNNRVYITRQSHSDETPTHIYTLECLPHSNLRSNNHIEYNSTLSTSPNVLSLDSSTNNCYDYATGDHYIAVSPRPIESGTNYNVKILSRKHGGVFTTFSVPAQYEVKAIEGKWVLLVNKSLMPPKSVRISGIMVFDIDNSVMCPGNIDDIWNATCFYKTTNNTAILYTARLVKDDDIHHIEWALHQFSSNNPVVQLRSGWFQLRETMSTDWLIPYSSYDSHIIIKRPGHFHYIPCIIHSVASSGQSHIPRNSYTMTDQHIPIPLLRTGCDHITLHFRTAKVWADLSYNDDQVLQIPGTVSIRHIIGDLYIFITGGYSCKKNRLLVDINTKEIIRELEAPNINGDLKIDTMVGTIYSFRDSHVAIIQEYGEL